MEGFVLAAGLGTRLRPLTNDRPKALVEVGGRTLLEHCVERLAAAGAHRVVVNVHHFADKMLEFIAQRTWPCEIMVSDEQAMLLDTGGALRHATPLFSGNETVVVHNVDVVSDIDLQSLVEQHIKQHNLATLCISRRATRRLLVFDADGCLVRRAEEGEDGMAFSGITAVSPELFALLPPADHPYPIIDEYIRLGQSHRIGSYVHSADRWLDVGKPDTLDKARLWYRFSTK